MFTLEQVGRVGRRLVTAVLMESEKQVIAFVRGYLLGRLLRVTPTMLSGAIREDTQLWTALPPGYKRMLHNFARSKTAKSAFTKYSSMVSAETLMKWMVSPYPEEEEPLLTGKQKQERRHLQGLASVILNYPGGKGVVWLSAQTDSIKNQFVVAMDGK